MLFDQHVPFLFYAKLKGFAPELIIDCGSNAGDWSNIAREIYPDPRIVMIDPVEVTLPNGKSPHEIKNSLKINACLWSSEGTKDFYFAPDKHTASTLFPETFSEEIISKEFKKITAKTNTLDNLISPLTSKNILLKFDIQGSELEAMKGGKGVLSETEIIICEVSFNPPKPTVGFLQVANWLDVNNFTIFEIFPCDYRAGFGHRNQADAVFVKKDKVDKYLIKQ